MLFYYLLVRKVPYVTLQPSNYFHTNNHIAHEFLMNVNLVSNEWMKFDFNILWNYLNFNIYNNGCFIGGFENKNKAIPFSRKPTRHENCEKNILF